MRAAAAPEPQPSLEGTTTFRSSDKDALFEELARSLAGAIPAESLATLPNQNRTPEPESDLEKRSSELIKLLADVTTGLWRLRLKMLPANAKDPSEPNRRWYKQLEAIMDTLTAADIQIRDHTGEAVPRGGIYTLKVLAYEPTAGLSREQVIETIKPTIHLKDRVIQVGEVIIGTPEGTDDI
jgi:hypothetical protein